MYAPHLGIPDSSRFRNGHLTRNSQHAPHLSHCPVLVLSTGRTRLVKNLVTLPSNGPLFVRRVSIGTAPGICIHTHILSVCAA